MKSLLKQKLTINRTLAITLMTLSAGASLVTSAHASQSHEGGAIIPCGSLQTFTGDVQVFDASRTQVVDVANDKRLQCGDWVAVNQGQATIRHHAGYVVILGAGSFIQIQDPQGGDNPEKDHFALYRGQAIFKSSRADQELKVATANARAKFKASEGYFLYSTDWQISQLVGISGKSVLENRFLDVRPTVVSTSEYASMGELEGRPIPSQARAVSMASVRERLARLGVKEDVQRQMIDTMRVLAQMKMPTRLEPANPERRIASELPSQLKNESARPSAALAPVPAPELPSMTAYELSQKPDGEHPISRERQRQRQPAAQAKAAIWKAEPRQPKSRTDSEKERILKELSEIEIE